MEDEIVEIARFFNVIEGEVACAQLCGNNHYSMRALMVVHERDSDFEAWLESQKVEEFDESRRPALVRIRAVIYVEKDSQKGIVIGKGGRLLKRVGQEAREEAERLLQAKVYLDLWVKVWKNWRRDPRAIRLFGYQA